MYPPYKHTLTPADRVMFEKWLLGTAVFYGAVALVVVCAIVLGHTIRGSAQSDVAVIDTSSPSLPLPAP
jgi:hypothetical protein